VRRLRRRAEVLLPLEREAARLALEAELRVLGELVHLDALLLHDRPRLVGAEGRLVAAGLAREAAVRVAHGGLVVALERVEVVVVARLLRVPLVVDVELGVEAPDVVEGRDVSHLRAGGADLHGRAGDGARVAGRGDESSGGGGKHLGDILDPSDDNLGSGQSSDSVLGSWSWGLGSGTTSGSELDVNGIDSDFLELFNNKLGGLHSSVWGGFFSIRGNHHTTGDSAVGFLSGEIGNVDESIVPGGEDVSDTENVFSGLWSELDFFLYLSDLSFL